MPEMQMLLDQQIVAAIAPAVAIATCGGMLRAFKEKNLKGFLVRLFSATIMGGVLGYAFRATAILPDFIKVALYFSGGFLTAEIAQAFSELGTTLMKTLKQNGGPTGANNDDQ